MVDGVKHLQRVQVISWLYLLVICVVSYVLWSWTFAWSTFAGGIVSIVSFQVAHKDVLGFVDSLTETGKEIDDKSQQQAIKKGKLGFLLKFWLRIIIIGVILLILIKYGKVNIFGLILGLSTVVFAVTFTALNVVWHYFIRRR